MLYTKRDDNKKAFTDQVFARFTDVCGGDAKEFADMLYNRYAVEDFAFGDDWYYFGVLKYFQDVVIPHKIAVWQAGTYLSELSWFSEIVKFEDDRDLFLYNIWVHDMSKFSSSESFGYAMHDFKNPDSSNKGHPSKIGFEKAWHHHKMHNPHHPEYWLNPNRSGILEPMTMPDIYILEMIADWIGAGKTYGKSMEAWLSLNLHKFLFHKETASRLKRILSLIGVSADFTGTNLTING